MLFVARPREERREIVASLRESGLSTRAIASVTGVNQSTISRTLSAAGDAFPRADASPAPRTVIGVDGKAYGRPQPEPPSDEDLFAGEDWVQPAAVQGEIGRGRVRDCDTNPNAKSDRVEHVIARPRAWAGPFPTSSATARNGARTYEDAPEPRGRGVRGALVCPPAGDHFGGAGARRAVWCRATW